MNDFSDPFVLNRQFALSLRPESPRLPIHYRTIIICAALLVAPIVLTAQSEAQVTPAGALPSPDLPLVHPPGVESAGAPTPITLADALERARKYDASFASAATDAKLAHEDRVQARAAMLPSANFTTQELLTKGNGTLPSGRYVTNDGVHVYRSWGVFHQDLSPTTYLMGGYRRASAAEALAQAKAEIARRGLVVTVTQRYYALIVAQRKYSTAQQAMGNAERFLSISRDREDHGEVAHSDVIKAELQFSQQKQIYQESLLDMDNTRLELAVLLSPDLNENITVVDDLGAAQALPPFTDVRALAERQNPDLRAALETTRVADADVALARGSFLPAITIDTDYGIEANSYALHSVVNADPHAGVLPNLGHFVTASLTLPLWDWGTMRSKLHQAEDKRQLARIQMSQTQRTVAKNLYSFYNEAVAARSEQETLHHAAELAAESLRLITLRYQAGESTILELVDAQNTLTLARNADDDGQLRYRLALANLQTLTGNF